MTELQSAGGAGVPPWEPPLAGSEQEHLFAMLDRLRYTFRWKADGLNRDDLIRTITPSGLSIGGLLKHLAVVEDIKFSWMMFGERPQLWSLAPEGADEGDWQFQVRSDESAADLYRSWDQAVARSREVTGRILRDGLLDAPSHQEFAGIHPSNRRFVCDLIEEYGRHTGHADLIREAIDGLVGEDPPEDWRPSAER